MSTTLEPPITKRQKKSERVREALLRDWRTSSDREIAAEVGASNGMVSQHRKKLVAEGLILPRVENTHGVEACLDAVCISAIEPTSRAFSKRLPRRRAGRSRPLNNSSWSPGSTRILNV